VLGGTTLLLALGALGLPGLGSFLAEFLILAGTWQEYPGFAAAASIGLVLSTVYSLWLFQRAFQGPNRGGWRVPDLTRFEAAMLVPLIAGLVWLGVYPQPVFDASEQAVGALPDLHASSERVSEGVQGAEARR
jgi:NADH-quinone oxidoreductase subunit M